MESAYRRAALATMATVSFACAPDVGLPSASEVGVSSLDATIAQCATTDPASIHIDTIATGLDVPWDVAFLPDGTALVTERRGRIRRIDADGVLAHEPWAALDIYAEAEAGLLGIDVAVEPDGQVAVFVAGTVQDLGSNRLTRILNGVGRRLARAVDPERGHARYLQVWRIPVSGGRAGGPDVIVSGLPAASVHAGGALRIGPDGYLYVSSGEAGGPATSQSESTTRGKIIRYTRDGGVPSANPTPGSPIYASGIRNVQGLDWYPPTGDLLAIDHGPTGLEHEGFRTDHDELNLVGPGANLGWPFVAGASRGGAFTSPIAHWTPAVAPAGLAVLRTPGSAWTNDGFVTGLRGARLERLNLSADGRTVTCRESLLQADWGRLRLVREAPDGTLWVGTSNRDHRGIPRGGSDLILSIRPPG